MKYKISVDRSKCIGCGACTNMCDNFKLVGEKASPVKPIVTEIGCNNEAKDICPVEAISVVEQK
jgi:ferredoxin